MIRNTALEGDEGMNSGIPEWLIRRDVQTEGRQFESVMFFGMKSFKKFMGRIATRWKRCNSLQQVRVRHEGRMETIGLFGRIFGLICCGEEEAFVSITR